MQKVDDENKQLIDAKLEKIDKQELKDLEKLKKLSDTDKETLQKIDAVGE